MPSDTSLLATWDRCPGCNGTGYRGADEDECDYCEGTGDRFGRGSTKPPPSEAALRETEGTDPI